MTIHKEGYKSIGIAAGILVVINLIAFQLFNEVICGIIFIITLALFLFIISFFRSPKRIWVSGENDIVAPADGKVVTIEEIFDVEYFKDKRIQVSIFMSPLNVHINRNPVSGIALYSQYHKGKYLVAWHPKSSTENERHCVVIENEKGILLVKQIAGAVAKRIVNYVTPGDKLIQSTEMGFIKFGSRVDVLLPLNANIKVQMNDIVKGGITVLASFKEA